MSTWLTLGDVLREKRRSYPMFPAVVCADVRLTYSELDARVNRLARALCAVGVQPGDRVLWLGQNCHRVLELLLASARLAATFVPGNWRQSPEELVFTLRDLAPRVVVWEREAVGDVVLAARERAGVAAHWVCHDDADDAYESLLVGHPATEPRVGVEPSMPVLGIYTGAFAGHPSCAMLDHVAIGAQSLVVALMHGIDSSTVYLDCGPLFHVGTLMSTLATLQMGGTNVFVPKADPELICRAIEQERCTRAFIVEPTRTGIVELVAAKGYDVSSLLGWPGSPEWNATVTLDPSLYGRNIGGYGQTELMGHVTFRGLGAPSIGEHGRSSPIVETAILGPEGDELAPGEVGEIAIRGPLTMAGYHDRTNAHAGTHADGWHHTGDLGRREVDGSITFVGPMTRMLKSGVENIYPAEVEACIVSHPDVEECAVIGVPDDTWAQSVKAIVVAVPGSVVTDHDIIEYCRTRIASYKKPRFVEFVSELPKVDGRIDYDRVDEAHGGGGYPGAS